MTRATQSAKKTEAVHKFELKSTASLNDARDVPDPEGYSVKLDEPLRKMRFDDLSFIPANAWAMTVTLLQSSVADWLISKQCDALLDYLKAIVAKAKGKRKGTFRVIASPDSDGPNLRVEMKNVDAASIDQIKTTVKEKLTAKGSERTTEITITFE